MIKPLALIIGLALVAFGATTVSASPQSLAPIAPTVTCASLAQPEIDAEVGAAVAIQSAVEAPIRGARFCQIKGTIAPQIRFELRLPVSGWTQRYLQTGCGGLCGVLDVRVEHADTCTAIKDNAVALASTDMGHQGRAMGDGSFGTDPQARIDFAYRGVHLTALAAKALIRKYYGQSAKFSYFSGCSDGGREALMEVERFPQDFNGVAAGAPAMNFQVQNSFYHAWMYLSNHRADGTAILISSKLPALHAAALASCDVLDGLKDGQITDPRACHFDPADAQCKPGQRVDENCLTAEEVGVAQKFYAGPTDGQGHRFTIGGPQVGSELSWRGVYVPDSPTGQVMSEGAALGTLKYLSFPTNPDASYSLKDFRFDRATFDRLNDLHPLYDATDTDLSGFQSQGGKLILWHGWSDPHISPINTIAFLHAVRSQLGAEKADTFVRLFLFPGLYHCGGGDGTSQFDILTPLMAWVEGGTAPDQIIAGHPAFDPMNGPPPGPPPGAPPMKDMGPPPMGELPPPPVTRTRPVFAYPTLAKWDGKGSPDQASSFGPAVPITPDPDSYDWDGGRFMAPGFHKLCEAVDGKLVCH